MDPVRTSSSSSDVVLALACPDRGGIVHAVSGFVWERAGLIRESQQYADPTSGRFFMRVNASLHQPLPLDELREEFSLIGDRFNMSWTLTDSADRPRVAILVSKLGHCLNDLLYRVSTGQLRVEVALVVSNHADLGALVRSHGIPFIHVPITPDSKPRAEARLMELLDEYRADFVVLARYMQVLSDAVCAQLSGRIINIHHSFLPSFKGGRPYNQAHERGVKLVGATAHYVTADLDEGPIIEQEVIRVDHHLEPADLVVAGRDAEMLALARAVRWHAEQRILLNGHRTVVFR
ncbi:formyltetrahydrofolate deformylase [Kribbella speibonae]|uniref:Formyltetrahydrofolate deformylase n=1 Tax=Kribbella speibonae TaxID=1572660 RepID=A0A4R0IRN1_9ACTN|nr:formyltetrahydrofolate deformylase [Kribbella speibonae]TCC36453.1 formyltetrahydrofolate deformylase [Kribbella speibonae]